MELFSLPVLKRHVRFQSRSSQRYRFGLDIPVVPFSQRDLVERRPASGPIRIGDGHKKAGVLLPERRLKASFQKRPHKILCAFQKDRYKFFRFIHIPELQKVALSLRLVALWVWVSTRMPVVRELPISRTRSTSTQPDPSGFYDIYFAIFALYS